MIFNHVDSMHFVYLVAHSETFNLFAFLDCHEHLCTSFCMIVSSLLLDVCLSEELLGYTVTLYLLSAKTVEIYYNFVSLECRTIQTYSVSPLGSCHRGRGDKLHNLIIPTSTVRQFGRS